jgi:hypothetical protein
MMRILANLDCEARWAGAPLPQRVLRRISAAAALLAYLVPEDTVEVWAPAEVDPARLSLDRRVTMRTGTPDRWDLAWADPGAKAANDRRLALAVHDRLGTRLPGARAITSAGELDGMRGPWVAKAPWTAAGRDRIHGDGPPSDEQRVYARRLIERSGCLIVEPWLSRLIDVGVTARLERGRVVAAPPHTLLTDARGAFLGIDLAEPPLTPLERAELDRAVAAAADALAAAGYAGPFTVDAFVYGPERRLHMCEINARHTFGHVARAIGGRVLGFGPPPPAATTLIAATADDPFTAWHA